MSTPPTAGGVPEPSRWHAYDLLAPVVATIVLLASAVLTVAVVDSGHGVPAPPPIVVVAPAPAPGSTAPVGVRDPVGVRPSALQQRADLRRFQAEPRPVSARWVAGFYPLYEAAQRAFGVDWLLIASVHAQETSFSTDPTTYRGLNYAGCCGGPMQFNVTNRPRSTWSLVADSYRYATRPAAYNHPTATHPSIYDDFDAIMAAGRLLEAGGARLALDGAAWAAAYDYYGHDPTGVVYADQVLARAIGWSEHGFCAACAPDPALVAAVHAAYGAPVRRALVGARAR